MNKQFKILLLGDSAVGKTSLLHQLADKSYSAQYKATLGVDSRDIKFQMNGQRITLVVWDTASQESNVEALTPFYFRGCDGVAFVYDATHPESLAGVERWRRLVGQNVELGADFPMILLGNKSDLTKQQRVQPAAAEEVRASLQMALAEMVSAKTGVNVEAAFRKLTALCIKRSLNEGLEDQDADDFTIEMREDTDQVLLKNGQKKKRCCCL